jgi:hypothetical protein
MQKKVLLLMTLFVGMGMIGVASPKKGVPKQDALVFSTTAFSDPLYGSAYLPTTITVSGGTGPYTFAVTTGSVPAGMALSSDGTLSGTPTAAGSFSFTVTATDAVAPPGQSTGTQDYTVVVDKVNLTIKANDVSKVYGAALPTFTFTYTGFANGDDASKLATPATGSTTATTASPIGTYPITAGGATSANYNITFNPGTLTVTAATLTATADNKTMFVGGPLPPFTVTYSGFVNGDGPGVVTSPSTATTTATTASPPGPYPITPAGGAAANYTFAYVNGTLTVSNKPTLTITADAATSVYGAPLVAPGSLTVTYSGFVNGDGPGNLTTLPTVSNSAVAGSPVGNTYVLTPSGASSPNYTIVYVNGTYSITKAPLTIKANDASKVYGAALPAFTFTYTGFVNGDDATKLTAPATASTTATAASPIGTYPITAGGATSSNYNITFNPGTLTVTAATLTATADNKTMFVGGPLPPFTVTYTGFVNGDGPGVVTSPSTATTTATTASPAGAYPITPAGGAAANYTFAYVNGTLTVSNKPTLTITANPATSVYGAPLVPNGSLTVTYSGFVNGDGPGNLTTPPTVSNSAVAGSPVGNTYVLTPSGASSPNYTIVYVNGTYSITKAPLTIKANDASKVYGAALPAFTFTYTGFVNGDDATKLTAPATASTTATAASPIGTYPITAAGATSSNYTITFNPGTLTVTAATLTATADNKTMFVGGPLPPFTVTYTGFVNGDGPGVVTSPSTATTTATAASPAGNYPITPAGGVAANYTFAYVNGTLTVSNKPTLTITANPATSVYGAPLVAPGALTVTYSGFVNGDGPGNLTTLPTVTNSALATSPAGAYVLTPGGASSPNYTIVYANGVYTISKAPLTIKANDASKVYGAALPAFTFTYTGFVNGDDATKLTTPATGSTTATTASPVGTYPITAAGATSPNYTITFNPGTLTVTAATLTATANNQTMPLGGPLPALTVSYSGFVNGDGPGVVTSPATATTTATAASPVGTYPITPAGGAAANYTFIYVNGTLSVGKAILTITANSAASVYGAPLVPPGSLTVSYSGFVNGDGPGNLTTLPTVSNSALATSPAGAYVLTASGAASPNYTFVYVTGVYTISKANLTVKGNDASMTYGGPVPSPLTVTYTGFVNGDDATKLTTAATATTTATSTSPAGTYPITPAGAASNNYTFTYQNGTMTVNKAVLTATANNQTMPLGGPLPALTVSYTGFVNGDGIASITSPATATTTATAASPAGTYVITPAGGAAANYSFVYVNGTLSVGKATLTITANPATSVYGAPLVTGSGLTVSYSGFVNGDGPGNLTTQPTVANSAVATSPVGTYVLTPSGATSPNYNIVYVNGVYTISKAPLTIKANDASKVYGAALPAFTFTYTGFVNGDDATKLTTPATASTTATAASPVGTYPITAAGATSANYAITFSPGTLTVTPANLTVTANNQVMPLGGPLPALTVSYAGFVNGETAAVLTTPATATTTATAASAAGTYPITPAGAAAANYSFTYVNGTLSVGKAILTITANPATSVYGAPLVTGSGLTVSYTGFVNGDGPGSLTTAPTVANSAVATSPAGSYVLTPSGAASANYNIVYVNGTYTITKAALTIKANDASMTYGGAVPGLTATYTGFVNGDGAGNLTTPPAITTTATSTSPAGAYPITAAGAASNNYDITYQAGTMTVNKATLTVTANDQAMPLGGPLPALTIGYTGFVNGEGVANLTTAPTATTTAIASSPVGSYPITPAGGVAANYTFNYVNGNLSVGKATLTITASPATSVYGAALVPSGSLAVTYSGFVNGDGPANLTTLPTVTNAAFAGAGAGNYALTPSGATSSNYNFNYVNGVYTITQAALNITPNNQTMVYGSPVPTLTAAYSGFVNGDNPGSLTNPPVITTTATAGSPVGTYPLTASGATAPNYIITYSPAVLTITKAPLTITADSKSMPLGGPLPALTISYAGFANGDNASSLLTQPTITTPATAASPAGAYPITVSGATSNNYTISYVTGILAVGKALLTITANPASSVYGAALVPNGSLTVSYTGFVNGDGPGSLISLPTVSNSAVPGSPAGNYVLAPSGAQSNNYIINYANGTYKITPAALTITAANKTMTYGGTVPPLTATYSGFVNGDDESKLTTAPTITTPASSTSSVGAYPINVSAAVDPNYTITYSAGVLTIGKATLTVTANSATMPYGGPLPVFTATYSGFVAGDNVADLTTAPAITTTALVNSPVGTYPITAAGGVSPNYNFVYNPGTLTIGAGTLRVTANPQLKEFGAADPALTYTVTGFASGDNSSVLTGSLTRDPGEALGTYAIKQGTLSGGNKYNITFTGNFLTIAVGTQQITWDQSLIVGCSDQTQIQLTASASSGLPITYTVSDPTVATVSGSTLTILKAGTAIVTATQPGDANHTAALPVKDTILYEPGSLIRQRWSDVIFFDNTAGYYESWQWYKNGSAVQGATDPYYSETPTLNGKYYVIATDKAGTKVQSCTLDVPPGAAVPGGIKVFPNPVAAGAQVTVTSNYSGTSLQGAVMTVVDLSGKVRQTLTNVQPTMQVTMPSETGTYIISLQLASGPRATVNVLVIQ